MAATLRGLRGKASNPGPNGCRPTPRNDSSFSLTCRNWRNARKNILDVTSVGCSIGERGVLFVGAASSEEQVGERDDEHRAPSTESTEHREHRAPSTEHRAPSTEHRAPSTVLEVFFCAALALSLGCVAPLDESDPVVDATAPDRAPQSECLQDPFADIPADPDTVPVAEVVLEDGRALGWYENHGRFFRVSRGTDDGLPTIANEFPELRELSPTEQWTFLSGGPVPPELEEYEERLGSARIMPASEQDANACEGGSTRTSVAGDHPQNRSNPCETQWWVNEFCNQGFAHQFCLVEHWNGAYHSINKVESYMAGVCGVIGNVSFRVFQNGWQVFTVGTVQPNQYFYYEWYATCSVGFLIVDCDDAYYAQVYNATNNKFHFYTGAFR